MPRLPVHFLKPEFGHLEAPQVPPCIHHILLDQDFTTVRAAICAETQLPVDYVDALAEFGAIYVEEEAAAGCPQSGSMEGGTSSLGGRDGGGSNSGERASDGHGDTGSGSGGGGGDTGSGGGGSGSGRRTSTGGDSGVDPVLDLFELRGTPPKPPLHKGDRGEVGARRHAPRVRVRRLSSSRHLETPAPAGTYVRVHQNPRRRREANLVNWTSRVLAHTKHFVVVDKPAGVPLQPGVDNLKENAVFMLQRSLGVRQLWVTGRLDASTTGVCVLAKSSEAAARVNAVLTRRRKEEGKDEEEKEEEENIARGKRKSRRKKRQRGGGMASSDGDARTGRAPTVSAAKSYLCLTRAPVPLGLLCHCFYKGVGSKKGLPRLLRPYNESLLFPHSHHHHHQDFQPQHQQRTGAAAGSEEGASCIKSMHSTPPPPLPPSPPLPPASSSTSSPSSSSSSSPWKLAALEVESCQPVEVSEEALAHLARLNHVPCGEAGRDGGGIGSDNFRSNSSTRGSGNGCGSSSSGRNDKSPRSSRFVGKSDDAESASGGGTAAAPSLPPLCARTPFYEVRVRLLTGRTHQIRLQLSAMGAPLVGDSRYEPVSGMLDEGEDASGSPKGGAAAVPTSCFGPQPWGLIGLHCSRLEFVVDQTPGPLSALPTSVASSLSSPWSTWLSSSSSSPPPPSSSGLAQSKIALSGERSASSSSLSSLSSPSLKSRSDQGGPSPPASAALNPKQRRREEGDGNHRQAPGSDGVSSGAAPNPAAEVSLQVTPDHELHLLLPPPSASPRPWWRKPPSEW